MEPSIRSGGVTVSILDGRATVTVQAPVTYERDTEWGTEIVTETREQVVRCSPSWLTPEEAGELEAQPASAIRVLARSWPGLPRTRFVWDGNEFEQIGPAKYHYGSRRTRHYLVHARHVAGRGQRDGEID